MAYTIEIYKNTAEIPTHWDLVIGQHNILLSKEYLTALEQSKPENMQCYFVGFFIEDTLIGGALFQYLYFLKHNVLQQDKLACDIRNFLAKKFSSEVLILGNNMLTGQNGFYFNPQKINPENAVIILEKAINKIQKEVKKPNIIILKDYKASVIKFFKGKVYQSYYQFSVQPNMVLPIRTHWLTFEDYLNDFTKKYKTRARSARKKLESSEPEIEKRELDLQTIILLQKDLNTLYHNVAENASINTFFLAENHFESLKKHLKDNFKVFGYFQNNKLIGFYSLIINLKDVDTYFLGYNKELQKEKQLYLNMLLDMVQFGIEQRFKKIIFGRTALEIKSTIGAEPETIYGLIKHNNALINRFMYRIFPSIEPKTEWIQRRPFK